MLRDIENRNDDEIKKMDELVYYKKAQNAFKEGDYKRSIVLLRRTRLDKPHLIQLFVDSCYTSWHSGSTSLTLTEIQDSYSKLFSLTSGNDIAPYEYVRLSHIYLKIGSIPGALKTMQYAGHSGHLNDTMVVLQTWTILRKIGSNNDAKMHLQHLTTLLPMEKPDPDDSGEMMMAGTNMPIYIPYLHVANQLQREAYGSEDKAQRVKLISRSDALLTESYTYHHQTLPRNKLVCTNWMRKSLTWVQVGHFLESGPFLLLAEESLWIAFIHINGNFMYVNAQLD